MYSINSEQIQFYLFFWNNFRKKDTRSVIKNATLINPNPSIKIKNKFLRTSDCKMLNKTREIRNRMKKIIKLFSTILILVEAIWTLEATALFPAITLCFVLL